MTSIAAGPAATRTWAKVGVGAQVIFLVSWLVAQLWQGPRYSPLAHTISDMYAVGAPHAWFLLVCLTLAGAGTILFALLGARPALRAAGWPSLVGSLLLALSILGLGDLLSVWERQGCRLADPGCTSAAQSANLGGKLDSGLSLFGLFALVAAGFFLAAAMGRLPAFRSFAWPARGFSILLTLLLAATGVANGVGLGGLFERLVATLAAVGVAALAFGLLRARPGHG
jgi:hypothetical protein